MKLDPSTEQLWAFEFSQQEGEGYSPNVWQAAEQLGLTSKHVESQICLLTADNRENSRLAQSKLERSPKAISQVILPT